MLAQKFNDQQKKKVADGEEGRVINFRDVSSH